MARRGELSLEDEYRRLKNYGPEVDVPISLKSQTLQPGQARKLDQQRWALREAAAASCDREGDARKVKKVVRIGPAPASSKPDDWVRILDAGVRAAADNVTLGMANKLAAGADTFLPLGKLTNPNTTSVWETGDIGKAFERNLAMQQAIDRADEKAHPVARFAGNVAGSVVGPVPGRGAIKKAADYGVEKAIRAGVGKRTAKALGVAGRGAGEGASQGFWHGLLSGGSGIDIPGALAAARDEAGQGVAGALAAAGTARVVGKMVGRRIAELPEKFGNPLRAGRYLQEGYEKVAKPALEKTIDEGAKAFLKLSHGSEAEKRVQKPGARRVQR